MKRTKKHKDFLREELRNPILASEYLNACLEDSDPKLILIALKDIAEAMGGIDAISTKTDVDRATLYRALSRHGNPEFNTFLEVLRALHLKFTFKSA